MYELHRPEQGKTVEVLLEHECRETCALLEPVLRQKDLKLELREPLAEVRVRLPEGAVRQILMNLVNNARDASPEGGTVMVGLTADEGGATISVTDRVPACPRRCVRKSSSRSSRRKPTPARRPDWAWGWRFPGNSPIRSAVVWSVRAPQGKAASFAL